MKIGLFSANGIGDFLLMMIVGHNANVHHDVTIIHPLAHLFEGLFPNIQKMHPDSADPDSFDQLIVQNDHSMQAYALSQLRDKGKNVVFLCYKPSELCIKTDILFDPKRTYADNLFEASKKLFNTHIKKNGIDLGCTVDKNKRQVAIHAFSKDPRRSWPLHKFLKLKKLLQADGYQVVFIMTPLEYEKRRHLLKDTTVLTSDTLKELGKALAESSFFIGNDSGPGHLASNLMVPTLTISGNPIHARIWRPGFFDNELVTLPFMLPKWKGIGFNPREDFWHYGITVNAVYKAFQKLRERHPL
jgi:hypothetical protein